MGTTSIGFTAPDEIVDKIDEEADQLGMSRAEYCRKQMNVGRRVMQASGKLDRELVISLVEGDSDHLTGETPVSPDEIEEQVLDVIPADSQRAVAPEEVTTSVFGSKEEQIQQVKDTLDTLVERGEITFNSDGKAYK